MSVTVCLVRLGPLHMSKHNHTESTLSCCVMFCLSCLKMPCKLILPFVNRMVISHHTLVQCVLSPSASPARCVISNQCVYNGQCVSWISLASVTFLLSCVCVALFVLNQYWGIFTFPVSFLKAGEGTWGSQILTLHLNYVAGYTGPLPESSSSNGPTTTLLTTRGFCPCGSVLWAGPKFFWPHW